ncbi:MAG TPA: type II toxin-antitoxin system prevent-host-death family antitoxin [Rhizomicrobium sp.]|nr:type II toxin-antitoxin system prevent-host-death family antitoxin [Rhizomicrobium sp.]
MSNHSVAETKNQLSELIDRAEKGEEIIITRHGRPVAKISGVLEKPATRRITQEDIDWLRKHRVGRKMPREDAVTLVRRVRDEEWP